MVIRYDPWWNLAAQNQATDRARQIGQLQCVQVYKLIAKDTIEQRILELKNNTARRELRSSGCDFLYQFHSGISDSLLRSGLGIS